MRSVVYGLESQLIPVAAQWAGAEDPRWFDPNATALGALCDGRIVAVAVFYQFTPTDCRISLASDGSKRWLTREFIVRVFAYPFVQMHLNRLTAEIPATNRAAVRLCQHFGFRPEGAKRKACHDGSDELIFGLLREECKWLGPRRRLAAAA